MNAAMVMAKLVLELTFKISKVDCLRLLQNWFGGGGGHVRGVAPGGDLI